MSLSSQTLMKLLNCLLLFLGPIIGAGIAIREQRRALRRAMRRVEVPELSLFAPGPDDPSSEG